MNDDIMNLLVTRAKQAEAHTLEEIDRVIEEALKDRLNEIVKMVQDYDVNQPFADLLRYTVMNKSHHKCNPDG